MQWVPMAGQGHRPDRGKVGDGPLASRKMSHIPKERKRRPRGDQVVTRLLLSPPLPYCSQHASRSHQCDGVIPRVENPSSPKSESVSHYIFRRWLAQTCHLSPPKKTRVFKTCRHHCPAEGISCDSRVLGTLHSLENRVTAILYSMQRGAPHTAKQRSECV